MINEKTLTLILMLMFSLIININELNILIAKKHLFRNRVPCGCGDGTVNFVARTNIEYIHDIEIREEGGTSDIIGSIRAGLVFQLKESYTYEPSTGVWHYQHKYAKNQLSNYYSLKQINYENRHMKPNNSEFNKQNTTFSSIKGYFYTK
ncbi:unnamed protein product [Rotaria sordida]|uniref:Uncharacterized protein n=1 Tax=Rotaria sordida TaxID=392033 RepID=A0A815J6L2_9BILA|nr:unnamed protein product [Rotaria sordida]CAF1613467.1 unnamed protein product [Rotaria sordida]